MMSISLQLTGTSLPLDGATSKPQSADSESAQPISFGELLKVEEKKLEHEINVLSTAIMFTTIQIPVMTESLFGFDPSAELESANSAGQTPPEAAAPQPNNSPLEFDSALLQTETKPVVHELQDQKQIITEVKDSPESKVKLETPEKINTGDEKSDHPKLKLAEPTHMAVTFTPNSEAKANLVIETKDKPESQVKFEKLESNYQPVKNSSGDELPVEKSDSPKMKPASTTRTEVSSIPEINEKEQPIRLTSKKEFETVISDPEGMNVVREAIKPASQNIPVIKTEVVAAKPVEPTTQVDEQTHIPPAKATVRSNHFVVADFEAKLATSPHEFYVDSSSEFDGKELVTESNATTKFENASVSESETSKSVVIEQVSAHKANPTNTHEQPIRKLNVGDERSANEKINLKAESTPVPVIKEAAQVEIKQVVLTQPTSEKPVRSEAESEISKSQLSTVDVQSAEQVNVQVPKDNLSERLSKIFHPEKQEALPEPLQKVIVNEKVEFPSTEFVIAKQESVDETLSQAKVNIPVVKVNSTGQITQPEKIDSTDLYEEKLSPKREVAQPVTAMTLETKEPISNKLTSENEAEKPAFVIETRNESRTKTSLEPAPKTVENINIRVEKSIQPQDVPTLEAQAKSVDIPPTAYTQDINLDDEASLQPVDKVHIRVEKVNSANVQKTSEPVGQAFSLTPSETKMNGGLELHPTNEVASQSFSLASETKSDDGLKTRATGKVADQASSLSSSETKMDSELVTRSKVEKTKVEGTKVSSQDVNKVSPETSMDGELTTHPTESKVQMNDELVSHPTDGKPKVEGTKAAGQAFKLTPSETKMNGGLETRQTNEAASQDFSLTSSETKMDSGELVTRLTGKAVSQDFSHVSPETKMGVKLATHPTSEIASQSISQTSFETKMDSGLETRITSEVVDQAFSLTSSETKMDGELTTLTTESAEPKQVEYVFASHSEPAQSEESAADQEVVKVSKHGKAKIVQAVPSESFDKSTQTETSTESNADDSRGAENVPPHSADRENVRSTQTEVQVFDQTASEPQIDGELEIRPTKTQEPKENFLGAKPEPAKYISDEGKEGVVFTQTVNVADETIRFDEKVNIPVANTNATDKKVEKVSKDMSADKVYNPTPSEIRVSSEAETRSTESNLQMNDELAPRPTSEPVGQAYSVTPSEAKMDDELKSRPTSEAVGQAYSVTPSETKMDDELKSHPTSEAVGQADSLTPSELNLDGGLQTKPTSENVGQAYSVTPSEIQMNGELSTRATEKNPKIEVANVVGRDFSQIDSEITMDDELTTHPTEFKAQMNDELVTRPTDEKPKVEGTKVSGQVFSQVTTEISMDSELTIRSTESKAQMNDELVTRSMDEKPKVEVTKVSGQAFNQVTTETSMDGELTIRSTESKVQTNDELVTRSTNEKPKVEGTKVAGQDLKLTSSETKIDGELVTRATSETVTEMNVEVAKIKTDNAKAEIHSEVAGRSEVKSEAWVSSPIKDEEKTESVNSNFVVGNVQQSVVVDVPEKLSVGQVKEYEVIQQITSQLKPRIKIGETSMRLTLKPDELGSIEVEMVSTAQGVSVSLVTEQASTGQLLESQVNQLKQSLKDAGVQLNNLNINQHNQPRHEGGAFRQEQRSSPFHAQDIQDGVPPEDHTQVERIVSPHEVDYLI